MVDTTATQTAEFHINTTERDIHYNSSQHNIVVGGSNLTVERNRTDDATYSLLPIASIDSSAVDTTVPVTSPNTRGHEDMMCGNDIEKGKVNRHLHFFIQ